MVAQNADNKGGLRVLGTGRTMHDHARITSHMQGMCLDSSS